MDSHSPNTCPAPFVDEFLRGRADKHKPTYRELRDEGIAQHTIELIHEGRDKLAKGEGFYDFAKWCAVLYRTVPLCESDSWPNGKTDRWLAFDEERYGTVGPDFDPTDDDLRHVPYAQIGLRS